MKINKLNRKKVKVGILGCGKMGIHHINAVKRIKTADLSALSDPYADPDLIKSFTQSGVRYYKDPNEMFLKEQLDVVQICTPPATHYKMAMLCLKNNVNVYVEKPFTIETDEADKILRNAQQNNLNVCAGHQILFERATSEITQYLDHIGKVINIESYFSFRQVRKNITAVEQVIDILPHPTYALLHFLGLSVDKKSYEDLKINIIEASDKGEVHCAIKHGDVMGSLIITLNGRPIESYIKIVGSNGTLIADFVRGTVIKSLGPGASIVSAVVNPYIAAKQLVFNTTKSFMLKALHKETSYPGLIELITAFYESIMFNKNPPVSYDLIRTTVDCCKKISVDLLNARDEAEIYNQRALEKRAKQLNDFDRDKDKLLVTGGTGLLGKAVASDLRMSGFPVTIIARRLPDYKNRIAGVDYIKHDLAKPFSDKLLDGFDIVIHCAAETAGNLNDHKQNTVIGTKNLLSAIAKSGIRQIINISSVAVMVPSEKAGTSLSEKTKVDIDNIGRGPYVWAKAKAEQYLINECKKLNISLKTVRLGPLVNYDDYAPPGRLGRELGPYYVAVGNRNDSISLCEVKTAVKAIKTFIARYDSTPDLVNLLDLIPPTRKNLVDMLIKDRPDLKVVWLPFPIVRLMSSALIVLQKIIAPKKKPLDVYAAFSSEVYDTAVADKLLKMDNN
jgi:predicted dehydrogenase/nucleoside-diphosphate-sugar epimerase